MVELVTAIEAFRPRTHEVHLEHAAIEQRVILGKRLEGELHRLGHDHRHLADRELDVCDLSRTVLTCDGNDRIEYALNKRKFVHYAAISASSSAR